ncbi:hypothetical protein CDAR_16811 [Caerostris darwini]|uniref:Uncharacterized protein n=1 Tax=Caerostris darwini TaxID=1538125 RepID=A0AAV4M9K7_9ARAC|nr:hypothetical protein CDAR_16811 [Caerostris darwini]
MVKLIQGNSDHDAHEERLRIVTSRYSISHGEMSKLVTAYETYGKPNAKVLDYNTMCSGIIAKDPLRVITTLLDVKARVLQLSDSNTILSGRALTISMHLGIFPQGHRKLYAKARLLQFFN